MKKIRDILAVTSTYTDDSGQERPRFAKCGALLQDETDSSKLSIAWDGIPDSAILHAAKGGKDTLWLSLFKPRDRDQQPAQNSNYDRAQQQANQEPAEDDDSIPF